MRIFYSNILIFLFLILLSAARMDVLELFQESMTIPKAAYTVL